MRTESRFRTMAQRHEQMRRNEQARQEFLRNAYAARRAEPVHHGLADWLEYNRRQTDHRGASRVWRAERGRLYRAGQC